MHDITNSPAYRKAFIAYLRRGISPYVSIKAETGEVHVIDKYIWRTQGDDKVRDAHAVLEGEVFSWDEPPSIGHPGQDHNCRCVAEPYLEDIDPANLRETSAETIIYAPEDKVRRWDSRRMYDHYLNGSGLTMTLQDIGHMQYIIDFVQNHPVDEAGASISRRVVNDIAGQIRGRNPGPFNYSFSNGYDFESVTWAHRKATLSANATGIVSSLGPFLVFSMVIDYRFSDRFRDPYSTEDTFGVTLENGIPYNITGNWRARIDAVIYSDERQSRYKRNKPLPK